MTDTKSEREKAVELAKLLEEEYKTANILGFGAAFEDENTLARALLDAEAEIVRLRTAPAGKALADAEQMAQLKAENEKLRAEVERLGTAFGNAETRWSKRAIHVQQENDDLRAALAAVVEELEAAIKREYERSWQDCTEGRSHGNVFALKMEEAISHPAIAREKERMEKMEAALTHAASFKGHHYAPLRAVGEECADALAALGEACAKS